MLVNPFQLSNMMPDYSRMIGIPINVTGTAPSDGYISIVGRGAAGGEKQLTEAVGLRINDVPVFTWGGAAPKLNGFKRCNVSYCKRSKISNKFTGGWFNNCFLD